MKIDTAENTNNVENQATPDNPMNIQVDGTPFSVLMKRAVDLKTAMASNDRTKFDSYPKFIQDTVFHEHGERAEEVARTRGITPRLSVQERLVLAEDINREGNSYFEANNYTQAYLSYQFAAGSFRYLRNLNPNWKNEVNGKMIIRISLVHTIMF